MNINDYKPNSHASKKAKETAEERPKVEQIVSGTVKPKKKSIFGKIAGDFVSEEASNIKTYIVKDVLIPAVKKSIADIVDMILFGGSRKGTRPTASRISYSRYYDEPRREPTPVRSSPGYNCEDVALPNRGEAEEVLDRLCEMIETYKFARVADFYDLVGVTCDYTANKYGWTNLSSAEIVRTRDGDYIIRFPRAYPID